MSAGAKSKTTHQERITISLAPGQRQLLESIAKQNNATLSYVIRYALSKFLEKREDKQLPLSF